MLDENILKIDEKQVVIIKEYTKEYRSKVINFLMEVAIEEFGFEDWRTYFNKAGFLEIKKPKENFWIAVDNSNNVIGTVGILEDKESGNAKLNSVYVKKQYRNKKIATALYNYSLEFAKKNNYENVILQTYPIFSQAIKFYEKNGFEISNDIKNKKGIWYIKNIK